MKKPKAPASRWPLIAFAVLLVSLIVAGTSQASFGPIGYFALGGEFPGSFETEPGALGSPSAWLGDVDVNANGTGGASPGDTYALGSAVRQLSASDEFTRTWGTNVVKSGPGQANETQGIRVDATGGSFKLGFGAATTGDVAAGASAAQVQAALEDLPSIGSGGVSVSGGPGDAGGTTPYIVTFDGPSNVGTDQPQLKALSGETPLSGGAATATPYTINQGGMGFEICDPANGDECQGSGQGSAGSIAVDQANGDVYITESNAIEKYSATGQHLRSWGRDVVEEGPDDSDINEIKSVTVTATGGTFTLGYRKRHGSPVQNTPALPFDASAEEVKTALDGLNEIGGKYSSVEVTEENEPEGQKDTRRYLITFHGLLGGDDLPDGNPESSPLLANPAGLTIGEGTKSAEVATVTDGGGEEVCRALDSCQEGAYHEGGESSGPQSIRTLSSNLAVAPAGAPNAGDVILGNQSRKRIQEYTPEGEFVRSFGWDVDETDPSTGFEVCTAESTHACKGGEAGAGLGQFNTLEGVAEDSTGAIYAVENDRTLRVHRVQKFIPTGGQGLTPSPFGGNERQELTVNAGAGQFRLNLGLE
ncbi:MAG TPA: hypothetical protein VJQ84_07255, partial [Solirubrobacterales bacterium]|nr:hypothetical protein [Solirubrobacterales bacterium]